MRYIGLKQRLLLFTLAIALILVIIFLFIIMPSAKTILSLRQDIHNIQVQLEERYIKTQKLKRSVAELNKIKELVTPYDQATISIHDQLRLITELERLALDNKVDQTLNVEYTMPEVKRNANNTTNEEGVTVAAPGKTTTRALPYYFKFSFLNNAKFEDHLTYLETLEKQPYYMVIENLQWEKRKNDNTSSTPITLRFEGIIYAQP